MDALPDPASKMRLTQPPGAARPSRTADYLAAAVIAGLAFAISPFALRMLTGRPELNVRALLLSVTFDVFLLLLAGAALARGRARRFIFALIATLFPLVALAALEAVAGALHLANHVALFQDTSIVKRGNSWGPGIVHLAPAKDGFVVYRPWSGNGVTINEVGLRTSPPTPKSLGEHRIAIVGSSETWGTRLADSDTIPTLLQTALHRDGRADVSIFNFGIEDADLRKELALLRHFKPIYDIDQVVFIAGGGDVYDEYMALEGQAPGGTNKENRIASFELYKLVERIEATWFETSQARLAQFDARNHARLRKKEDRLVDGIIAADNYCTAEALRCDFVLQPLISTRRPLIGSEARLAQTYGRLYPRLDVLAAQMYRDALDLGLAGRIHNLAAIFNNSPEQYYFDGGHVNEAGNLVFVDALLPIVTQAAAAPK